MKGSAMLIALVGLVASSTVVGAAEANPLSKVIDLMDALSAKVTKEGDEEAKAFKEYVEWCDDTAANLANEIKTGSSSKEELEATISKATADIEASTAKIEDLSAAIASDEKELKEA